MAFDIIKWIIMILIILVTLGVLFGLIWGSLLEERSYSKRSKAKKEKEVEKIYKWQVDILMKMNSMKIVLKISHVKKTTRSEKIKILKVNIYILTLESIKNELMLSRDFLLK